MDYQLQLLSFLISFLFGLFFSFTSRVHYNFVFSLKMVWHNPLRVFDKFPAVLMTCYLFHANVLKALSGVIASQYVKTDAFTTHLIQMIAAFLVTLTGALLISRLNHIN